MSASSIFMGIIGVAMIFSPDELALLLGSDVNFLVQLLLSMSGALYFGFAVLNWMAKNVLIGGIYARPLAMGNFSHFLVGGIALIKLCINNFSMPTFIYLIALVYFIFAVLFLYVIFKHPEMKTHS
ncbi:MAG: hypothetical protein IE891_07590 [Flavobacteriaceae bacterium]|nr:hypothetical protein [Flavobacteriaceae bacterium]